MTRIVISTADPTFNAADPAETLKIPGTDRK